MLKKIKSTQLKKGMFVNLPGTWLSHSFVRNKFLIRTDKDISEIVDAKIPEVTIDTSKGFDLVEDLDTTSHGCKDISMPIKWEPEKSLSGEFKEAIKSKSMAPDKKAKVVYNHSLSIMKDLFDNPKAEKIQEVKETVYDIVDLILTDDETPRCLLDLTSHDFYTYTHSVNVGVLSIALAKVLFKNHPEHNMQELGAGFFLHDLGKVQIDPGIINKPGRLTDAEMKNMRTHPYQGYKMLKEANQLNEECKIIGMQHHERDDGTGYPRKLKGDEIHIYGRICCIADVYDALTAERSYKPSLAPFEALKIMKEEMLGHFHKDVFQKFVLLFN